MSNYELNRATQSNVVKFLNGETIRSIRRFRMDRLDWHADMEYESERRQEFLRETLSTLKRNYFPEACFGCTMLERYTGSSRSDFKSTGIDENQLRLDMQCRVKGCDKAKIEFLKAAERAKARNDLLIELVVERTPGRKIPVLNNCFDSMVAPSYAHIEEQDGGTIKITEVKARSSSSFANRPPVVQKSLSERYGVVAW